MSDLSPRSRALRSDAIRSRSALTDAAIRVLADDPDADLTRIAAAAGLSRQTLYAHFGSRAGLLGAVVERITADVVRLLSDARLEEGTARDALLRFVDLVDRLPRAWVRVATDATEGQSAAEAAEQHVPVVEPLTALVRHGQADGEFTTDLPADWLTGATVALGHAAYEMESRGALTREQSRSALHASLLRLYAAEDHPTSGSDEPPQRWR